MISFWIWVVPPKTITREGNYHGSQEYGYAVKNHIVPYIGDLRISEVNRETFFNLLVKVLPVEEASQVTIRATRKVLSAMCQMAFDEGYRTSNPVRSIRIQQAPAQRGQRHCMVGQRQVRIE